MIDLDNFDSIRTPDAVMEAIQATFDADSAKSAAYIFAARFKLKTIAKELGCEEETKAMIDYCERNYSRENYQKTIHQLCACDRKGNVLNIMDNYTIIMEHDPYYAGLRKNAMSLRFEKLVDGAIIPWTDADDANSRSYLEKQYGIYSARKHDDALNALFETRLYNPIKDLIERLEWDGTSRIPQLLNKWMNAEDDEYTREVSRLIFAGGIHRLYSPGCKFEDMPVLVGGQGAGKSTFVRLLAMEDRFYSELTVIEGKESAEAIEGSWIIEVSELLALTKQKEQESVKAYLSRLTDKYRPAYARRVIERPRTCVFIGTTNREQFITDKTGGRRFYPVKCSNTGYSLFDHIDECREYIRQCWAEAYAQKDTPFMAPYARRDLKACMEERQQEATEEDIRVGLIEEYLERFDGNAVCIGMLWEYALGCTHKPPERVDQTQIGLIMRNMRGWRRMNSARNFGRFGKQRYWQRLEWRKPVATHSTPNDDVPF